MKGLNEDNKAWVLLSIDERDAIKLNLGLQKSTWEASEIMGKSHYKYLEILGRAKAIFKMFSEYFEITGDQLIPDSIELDEDFRDYMESTITYRMKVREATNELKNKYSTEADRALMIKKNMQKLKESGTLMGNQCFELILEFDRWNNFRILPNELQEPHAFKRRNKKRIQKYLNNLTNLESFVISSIKQKYALKTPKGDSLYFALPIKNTLELSEILYIDRTELSMERFTKAGLFLFANPENAKEFLSIVTDYFGKDKKHCKEGQIFWPRLREVIKYAVNFNDIERLNPHRKNLSEATKNLDKAKVRNFKNKLAKDTQK